MSASIDTPHLLAIDIGNSATKYGLYKGLELVGRWRAMNAESSEATVIRQEIISHLGRFDFRPEEVEVIAVASVVPAEEAIVEMAAKGLCDKATFKVSSLTYPYPILVREPHRVGADRLAAAAAGYTITGGPLIVIQIGTAITLDMVGDEGAFHGGIIFPGPSTAAHALAGKAAQLPIVDIDFPTGIIGDDTVSAIQSGLSWGIVAMLDGLIEQIEQESSRLHRVLTSGGYGEVYALHSRRFRDYRPNLVLDGINRIYRQAEAGT
ncbi:MAG: type III pantothenate kinase [Calditrichaeota bacterium]|nr:type III pantothenate kinase [Calditrichota bacterium]